MFTLELYNVYSYGASVSVTGYSLLHAWAAFISSKGLGHIDQNQNILHRHYCQATQKHYKTLLHSNTKSSITFSGGNLIHMLPIQPHYCNHCSGDTLLINIIYSASTYTNDPVFIGSMHGY